MGELRAVLGDSECLRVGRMWWFVVVPSVVFTVAESGVRGSDVLVAILLTLTGFAGLAGGIAVSGLVVRRMTRRWHWTGTLLIGVVALGVGWAAVALMAVLLGEQGTAMTVWRVSQAWVLTCFLTVLLVMAGEQNIRASVGERQALLDELDRLEQRVEATEAAIERVTNEVTRVKRGVAEVFQANPEVSVVATEPIREQARTVSHRISALEVEAGVRRRSGLAWAGLWLDDIAFAPHWRVGAGFALSSLIIAPRVLLVSGLQALPIIASYLVAAAVASVLAHVAREGIHRMPVLPRRMALPLCIALPLTPVMAMVFATRLDGVSLVAATLATVPLASIGALTPTMADVDARRRDVQRRNLSSRLTVARCRLDGGEQRLRRLRDSSVADLHASVQGSIVAFQAAAQLQDVGVEAAAEIRQRALEGLAAWVSSTTPSAPLRSEDPLECAIAPWVGLLDVTLEIETELGWDARLALAPFLQDALVNAVAHGRARCVDVRAGCLSDQLVLVVEDDGVGPGTVRPGLGMGRVTQAGGAWALTRSERGGARFSLRLPDPGVRP